MPVVGSISGAGVAVPARETVAVPRISSATVVITGIVAASLRIAMPPHVRYAYTLAELGTLTSTIPAINAILEINGLSTPAADNVQRIAQLERRCPDLLHIFSA